MVNNNITTTLIIPSIITTNIIKTLKAIKGDMARADKVEVIPDIINRIQIDNKEEGTSINNNTKNSKLVSLEQKIIKVLKASQRPSQN